jgi:predicted HAD superfamily Cof-like phosphohydrolase
MADKIRTPADIARLIADGPAEHCTTKEGFIGMTREIIEKTMQHWDPYGDVEAFHKKFNLEYNGPPRALLGELRKFRKDFILEEANEYASAGSDLEHMLTNDPDNDQTTVLLAEQLDALIDLLYVALGAAYLQGFTRSMFVEAWNRVQEANMAKIRAARASDSKRGTTFDVVKPPGWAPPFHLDLVEGHAHRFSESVIPVENYQPVKLEIDYTPPPGMEHNFCLENCSCQQKFGRVECSIVGTTQRPRYRNIGE